MDKYILGLSAKSGAGKSTMAAHLVQRCAGRVRTLSFADSLRRELDYAFDDSRVDWYRKPTPTWMRNLLIAWGNARREQDPDYWVEAIHACAVKGDFRAVIIDDVRYKNEADWIKRLGGHVIRLECVPAPLRVSSDASETELDDYAFDHTYTIPYGGLWGASKDVFNQYLRHRIT